MEEMYSNGELALTSDFLGDRLLLCNLSNQQCHCARARAHAHTHTHFRRHRELFDGVYNLLGNDTLAEVCNTQNPFGIGKN